MAPAMNTNMLDHAAVQQNLQTLASRGVRFVDPGEGFLACGWIGKGRLAEPEVIVEAAERVLRPSGSLLGRRIVISAGPTFEDLDPVRFIGNRVQRAYGVRAGGRGRPPRRARSARVRADKLDPPAGALVEQVRNAEQMATAMTQHAAGADAVIMAAAVADYTPEHPLDSKMPKGDGPLQVTLIRTRDILAELGGQRGHAPLPVLRRLCRRDRRSASACPSEHCTPSRWT
jgi:phosphopantothenoylcysteine decarboxylase/phosphopantothenate--cysteine ligase